MITIDGLATLESTIEVCNKEMLTVYIMHRVYKLKYIYMCNIEIRFPLYTIFRLSIIAKSLP
jgi:hypothetical protein